MCQQVDFFIVTANTQRRNLFPVHLQVSKSFLGKKNLRYEPAVSLSERSLRRSEFEKTAHAFSRFFLP